MADPKLPYQTDLAPADEAEFQRYTKTRPGPKFDPSPSSDYDERGQWAAQKKGLEPDGSWTQGKSSLQEKADGPHGSDVWKTPYHRGFSRESKYSMSGRDPSWDSTGRLKSPLTDTVVRDESENERKTDQMRALPGLKPLSKYGNYPK